MSWRVNKYDKPSWRRKEGGKISSLYKKLPNRFKKCWRCHKRRISPYHHNLCNHCGNQKYLENKQTLIKENNI